MWTVYRGQGKQEHAFLILSRNEFSMIVRLGNLGFNQLIVQVTQDSVFLPKGSDLVTFACSYIVLAGQGGQAGEGEES